MKTNRNFYLLILSIALLFVSHSLMAYDFSDVRRSLQSDSEKWTPAHKTARLAIIFDVTNQAQVKQKFNLVRLKRNLAHDLLAVFPVADPIIVGEIMRSNQLTAKQLKSTPSLLQQFADRSGSQQVLFANFTLEGEQLNAEFTLLTPEGEQISQVIMGLSPEEPSSKPQTIVKRSVVPESRVFQSMAEDFSVDSVLPDNFSANEYLPDFFNIKKEDESWLFFNPTGFINPFRNSIEMNAWLKHLADTDIRPRRFRYDLSLAEMFQFSLQSNASLIRTHRSSYALIKYQAIDETVFPIPLNISLGLKKRVFWNTNENTEFNNPDNDDDLNEKNDKRNRTSLFLAASGQVKTLRSFYNLYVDNQTLGAGFKVSITKKIKAFVDSYLHYYDGVDTDNASDAAVGIQFYNSNGFVSTLAYQAETEQTQFIVDFNF